MIKQLRAGQKIMINKIKNLIFTPTVSGKKAVQKAKDGNVLFLDVRESIERKKYIIQNSKHISSLKIKTRIKELEEYINYDIIVYCASGIRSKMTTVFLNANGFNAFNLKGGIKSYLNAENNGNSKNSNFT